MNNERVVASSTITGSYCLESSITIPCSRVRCVQLPCALYSPEDCPSCFAFPLKTSRTTSNALYTTIRCSDLSYKELETLSKDLYLHPPWPRPNPRTQLHSPNQRLNTPQQPKTQAYAHKSIPSYGETGMSLSIPPFPYCPPYLHTPCPLILSLPFNLRSHFSSHSQANLP